MEVVLGLIVVLAALAFIVWPLFNGPGDEPAADARRAELEIEKENKYREIRDLELDYKAGKLTEEQWHDLDRDLRREAMLILGELDAGRAAPGRAAADDLN